MIKRTFNTSVIGVILISFSTNVAFGGGVSPHSGAQHSSGNMGMKTNQQLQMQQSMDNGGSDCNNPFYPKYLKKNIDAAIDKVVEKKIEAIKKKMEEAEKRKRLELQKLDLSMLGGKSNKDKNSTSILVPEVPSFLQVNGEIKKPDGEIVLFYNGETLKVGGEFLRGTIYKIDDKHIYLKRKEGKKRKKYKIEYAVSF